MATQALNDAVVDPQDPGTGSPSPDPNAAAIQALARSHLQGSYVPPNGGLEFQAVDTANDQVDIAAGYCYIVDDISSTAGSRGSGGNPATQSTTTSGYDAELPADPPYVVALPTATVDVGLDTDAVNDVYLSVDPTAQNSVTLHYGSAISAPSDPSLKLGTVDTSSGDTTRASDRPAVDARTVSAAAELTNPVYPSLSDVPAGLPEGTQVYVADEDQLYLEDGT